MDMVEPKKRQRTKRMAKNKNKIEKNTPLKIPCALCKSPSILSKTEKRYFCTKCSYFTATVRVVDYKKHVIPTPELLAKLREQKRQVNKGLNYEYTDKEKNA